MNSSPNNTHFDFSSPTDHVSARSGGKSSTSRVRRSVRSVLDSASNITTIQHRVISFVLLLILVVTLSFLLISIRKSKDAENIRVSEVIASSYRTIYTGDGYSIRLGVVPDFVLRNDRIISLSRLYPDKNSVKNTWYLTKDGKETELMSVETMENIASLTSADIVARAKKQTMRDSVVTDMTQEKQGVQQALISPLVRAVRTNNSIYLLEMSSVSDTTTQQRIVDSIQFD
jgi:hypothetical protein